MLSVGRLKVLTEVVRRGSFSGAAEALSYTQSAVSQAVAWETALCDVEEALRPLWADMNLRPLAERIGTCLRGLRLHCARGPDRGASLRERVG